MALSHGDHKRIAQSIHQGLQRVLRDANGARLLARHKARIAPHQPDPMDDDEMLAAMQEEPEMKQETGIDEGEEDRKMKKGAKGGKFPFPGLHGKR